MRALTLKHILILLSHLKQKNKKTDNAFPSKGKEKRHLLGEMPFFAIPCPLLEPEPQYVVL